MFFHCCDHTSEENTVFEMNSNLRKLQKRRNLETFLDVTNGLEIQISHTIFIMQKMMEYQLLT